MKYLRLVAVLAILVFGLVVFQSHTASAFPDPFHVSGGGVTPVCGTGEVGNAEACVPHTTNPILGPTGVLTRAASLVMWIVGLAAVVGMAYGGLQYIISRGDAQRAVTARNIILYSAAGLVVAVMAQAIIAFTINRVK